ncbi:hypothetical protein D4Z76_09485, partial [Campylobacter coli]
VLCEARSLCVPAAYLGNSTEAALCKVTRQPQEEQGGLNYACLFTDPQFPTGLATAHFSPHIYGPTGFERENILDNSLFSIHEASISVYQ